MTETNGTNGHPFPDRPAADVQARPEPTRELVVAVWDGEVLLELAELGTEELLAECRRRGLLSDSPAGFVTRITRPLAAISAELAEAVNEGTGVPTAPAELGDWSELVTRAPGLFPVPDGYADHPDTERPPATEVEGEEPELGQVGNPERDPRLEYREVGMLPSERATEIACARLGRRDDYDPFGGTPRVTPNMHDVLKMLDERFGRE